MKHVEKQNRTESAGNGAVVEFTCGAKRSYTAPHYTSIPYCALRRLALRYNLGSAKYDSTGWMIGRLSGANWKKGDREFFSDAFNHVIDHLYRFLEEGNEKTDNLAAAAWGIFALMWAEENGVFEDEQEQALAQDHGPQGPEDQVPPRSKIESIIQELFGTTK